MPHRMTTSPSSQRERVPAEQGRNAIENLLAGKKTLRAAPAGREKGKSTGRLVFCPGMSVLAEREKGLESRGSFFFPCLV